MSISDLEAAKTSCRFMTTPPKEEVEYPPMIAEPENSSKTGTGFIVNEEGYVLTNNHVVENCSNIFIKIHSNTFPFSLVWSDEFIDLSILQSKDIILPSYAIFSEEIRSVDEVLALGFPLGEARGDELKVTKGNISAMTGYKADPSYLQFTAPIQPGNSGGPLLNEYGHIVGINTSALIGEELQNINFAIKGTKVQQSLAKNSIKFKTESISLSSEPMKGAELAALGGDYTGQILCTGANN